MNQFTYVKIPALSSEPLVECVGDAAGGLEHDALVAAAREYFTNGSCDIMAVTVPTATNDYRGVSLYTGSPPLSTVNERANEILWACGHAVLPEAQRLQGDVFIGRYHDDEAADIWQRLDFTAADVSTTADWCRVARQPGGGGGSGRATTASSLSGLLQSSGAGSPAFIAAPTDADSSKDSCGYNGAPPVLEPTWGCSAWTGASGDVPSPPASWTQSDDEVEIKLLVPTGSKTRDCRVSFGREQLAVTVHGQSLLPNALKLFDPIDAEESTFTLQDSTDTSSRELCITLIKTQSRMWPWVLQ
jgi:CS domain